MLRYGSRSYIFSVLESDRCSVGYGTLGTVGSASKFRYNGLPPVLEHIIY
jgi:hypothetical protein